jgi:hypothetical protein
MYILGDVVSNSLQWDVEVVLNGLDACQVSRRSRTCIASFAELTIGVFGWESEHTALR